ncbi:hypothetical protein SKAU_G00359600 [Synaphobranchus kaupii]|uniref:Uncharacterized protein n=1 Tax=Synaphobranchus kaupii TaxID=118154 RepID=A0A9Q1EI15_SYNKA|nr:hypothetical protein SKAU_G00359600 [Synaphobranchus kaupii]
MGTGAVAELPQTIRQDHTHPERQLRRTEHSTPEALWRSAATLPRFRKAAEKRPVQRRRERVAGASGRRGWGE